MLERFVLSLDLGEIGLMVQDWGGPIGLGFAGRHPDRIRALIISNTWAWPAQGTKSYLALPVDEEWQFAVWRMAQSLVVLLSIRREGAD